MTHPTRPGPRQAFLFVERWVQGVWPISHTPAGLAYHSAWASLRNAATAGLLAAAYGASLGQADAGLARKYACWARGQARGLGVGLGGKGG